VTVVIEEEHAGEHLDLAFGGDEGLPQQEEAEVNQEPAALELASGRRRERGVQRQQHGEHDPAPAGRDRHCKSLRCGAGEAHVLASASRQPLSEARTVRGSKPAPESPALAE